MAANQLAAPHRASVVASAYHSELFERFVAVRVAIARLPASEHLTARRVLVFSASRPNCCRKHYARAGITLPGGWAETLLRSGKLTVGTLPLDTGAAAWTNTHLSKFSCNEIHNSHVHIGLDDTKLIK